MTTLTIATLNAAAQAKPWQRQTFTKRLPAIGRSVDYYHPAILAVQESGSLSYLRRLDRELARRDLIRAPKGGRWRHIYFDPHQVERHDSGLIWLRAIGKYAAWGKFSDRVTGSTLFVTSVHLVSGDESKKQARYKQGARLLDRSRQLNPARHPEIHAGDYNSWSLVGDTVFRPRHYVDALHVAGTATRRGYDSYNGRTTVTPHHNTQMMHGNHYDHVYVSPDLASHVAHWSQLPSVTPSDHNMVAVKVELS